MSRSRVPHESAKRAYAHDDHTGYAPTARKREHPAHLLDPAMPDVAHERDRLEPTEAFFDALALPLAHLITAMSRCAPVDCAAACPLHVLRNVRRHVQMPALYNEVPRIVCLVRPSRDLPL